MKTNQSPALNIEHAEHQRILQSISEVDALVINATSLDEMLDQVLERFLEYFDCQRAWLLHPCVPDAPTVVIPK